VKTSIAVLVLLVAVGTVYTQAPPPTPATEGIAPQSLPATPTVGSAASAAKERSINQLLDEIQAIRVQQKDLVRREQVMLAEVRKLVEQQNERLKQMGLSAPLQPPAAVDFAVPATPGEHVPAPSFPVPAKQ
jgi:hypothetical protein